MCFFLCSPKTRRSVPMSFLTPVLHTGDIYNSNCVEMLNRRLWPVKTLREKRDQLFNTAGVNPASNILPVSPCLNQSGTSQFFKMMRRRRGGNVQLFSKQGHACAFRLILVTTSIGRWALSKTEEYLHAVGIGECFENVSILPGNSIT